jgi:hypothetical protein
MKRRAFITVLGGTLASPVAVLAQQPERMRRVGLLWGQAADDPEYRRRFSALAEGLQEFGSKEKNLTFAQKHAVGSPDRFSAMAVDLVRMNSEVIVTQNAGLASLARQATRSIPIDTCRLIEGMRVTLSPTWNLCEGIAEPVFAQRNIVNATTTYAAEQRDDAQPRARLRGVQFAAP